MTVYFGSWENDKRSGYGVFEDTVRSVSVHVCTVCMEAVWEGAGLVEMAAWLGRAEWAEAE